MADTSLPLKRTEQAEPSRKLGKSHIRWWIIALCFLATTINYIDRTNIAVGAPFIQKDLHINPAFMGLVLSAFSGHILYFSYPQAGSLIALAHALATPSPASGGRS